MTITTNPARNEYTANAGQTVFNYTFKIFADTDLNVYITPSGQDCDDSTDLTTAYTVTGVGDEDGGTIVLNSGTTLNDLVTIVSDIPSSRTTDYQNNGDFRPDVVNDDFDRVVSLVKKTEDTVNRSLLLSQCQQGSKPLSIPAPVSGRFLRWKGDLSGLENVTIEESDSIVNNINIDNLGDYSSYVAESVSDMINGDTINGEVSISHAIGQEWSTGTDLYRVISITNPMTIADFKKVSGHRTYNFATVATVDTGIAIGGNSVDLQIGNVVVCDDYASGNNAGKLFFRVVAAGTGTHDGGKYIDLPSLGLQLEQNVRAPFDVKAWGAVGVGVSNDDTAAVQACIDYASSKVGDRLGTGVAVYFPGDSAYYITATVDITQAQISLIGDGHSSVILTNNQNFNVFRFIIDTGLTAAYGCSVRNMRFRCLGDATSGFSIIMNRVIYGEIRDVWFDGYFDAIGLDGCAKVMIDNVIGSQEARTTLTTPRYGIDFRATNFNCSDIHISNYQFTYPVDKQPTYAVSIRGADGLYFTNGHHQSGMIVQPSDQGAVTTASVFVNQVYFDTTDGSNVVFSGTATNYRNFKFTNCYMRTGVQGMQVLPGSTMSDLLVEGCTIASHDRDGIQLGSSVIRAKIVNCTFRDNCTDASSGDSDIRSNASSLIINANSFESGGTVAVTTRCITLNAITQNTITTSNDTSGTSQTTRYLDSGTGNISANNIGF